MNERRDEETVTEINVEVDASALSVAQGTKLPPVRRPAFSSSGHEDPTRRRKIPFPVEELESEPTKERLPQLGDRIDTEETTAQGYVGARPLPSDARWVRKKAMTMLGLGPHGARSSEAKAKREGAVKPTAADVRAIADTVDAEMTEPTIRREVVTLEPEQATDTSVMSEPELVSALIAAAEATDADAEEDEVLPSHELRTDPGTGSDPALSGPTFPKRAPALSQLPTVPRPFSPKNQPAERAKLRAPPFPPSTNPAATPSTSEAAVVVAQPPPAEAAPPSSRRSRRLAAAALGGALLCASAAVFALRATGDGGAPALPRASAGAISTAAISAGAISADEETPPGAPSGPAEPVAAEPEPEPVAAQPEAPEASPAGEPETATAPATKTPTPATKARVARPARAPKRAAPKARTTAPPPPKGFEPSAI